jgi:hypothetical protein
MSRGARRLRARAGSNWNWFATAGSHEDDDVLFFGRARLSEEELGYFALFGMVCSVEVRLAQCISEREDTAPAN